jgi:hypothetical protein
LPPRSRSPQRAERHLLKLRVGVGIDVLDEGFDSRLGAVAHLPQRLDTGSVPLLCALVHLVEGRGVTHAGECFQAVPLHELRAERIERAQDLVDVTLFFVLF